MSEEEPKEVITDVTPEILEAALFIYTKVFHAIEEWGITDQAIFLISDEIHTAVPEIKAKKRAEAMQKISIFMKGFSAKIKEMQDVQPQGSNN
jgi:hypothetical protein